MISVSGIRGIVGEGLTPEVTTAYAAAFGSYCGGGKVIVGRDTRTTGEMVRHAALAGLLAVGCDVVDLGIVPTPTIELAVAKSDASGGIAFTASHNSDEWNALKFFSADGIFLDEVQARELNAIKDDWKVDYVPWSKIGHVSLYQGAVDDHISAVLQDTMFDLPVIRKRNFRVAVDAVCGAGCYLLPQFLAELGCEVVKVNCEIKGRFPRNPEPLPEYLGDLCNKVKEESCDLGLALDPDADRLAIIDDKGEPIGEENTLVIAARLVLKHKPGPLVTNVSSTRALDDIAKDAGVPIHRTKVGEIHVVKKMQDVKAAIGGEGNGGVIYPGVHLGRDSAVGTAMVLQALIEADCSLSEFMKSMPDYTMAKTKISIEDYHRDELLAALHSHFKNDEQDRTDGLKIIRQNGWFQMRPSNTEPVIRIYAEGEDQHSADAFIREGTEALEKLFPQAGSDE
ncbi:phosphoglucosamine mutase [candidate division LCP-89 bacterium B3_LCP]|uniref:Phosphoglucosamine mutase n=1 Tax=candidate division LCP-89 bacterium B3_LCP TaxID=2012998 RepID=A0A532UYU3_UNCL8|nr:MAG: phosphoglucosamine mutase [candidate division LCP-89 bacterium B3_LCP]